MEKPKPPERLLKMLEMHRDGYSYPEIGYKFKITRQRVEQLLRLDNIRRYDIDIEEYIKADKGE